MANKVNGMNQSRIYIPSPGRALVLARMFPGCDAKMGGHHRIKKSVSYLEVAGIDVGVPMLWTRIHFSEK